MFEKDIEKVLYSADDIKKRIKELAAEIEKDYAGKEIIMVCLLKGAAPFMADLAREINLVVQYDFMSVSSYGNASSTSGNVKITKDLSSDILGKHVIVVEDIVDTGLTLDYILRILGERQPESLRLCALLDKTECRRIDVGIDYKGFEVPDEFIVGYGLDYAQKYRNLPYVGVLKKSVYDQ